MNNENIKPVGNRYLVKIYRAASQSESGLILENSSNTSAAPVMGTVLEVGDNPRFQKGDTILFRRYSVDELKYVTEQGEQVVHLVEENDVVGIIKK